MWDRRKRCGTAESSKTVNETRPDRLRSKREFQNCLWNFSSSNIKKVTDLTSLMLWDRRKRRVTVKNGKTVNETRPDRLRLKWEFQNCLWNFSTSSIKEVMNLLKNISQWVSVGRTGPSYREALLLITCAPRKLFDFVKAWYIYLLYFLGKHSTGFLKQYFYKVTTLLA